jgi:hypothetical protein
MMIINALRKNIGTIIASFGFILLCILTFGDLGEVLTEQYWQNVYHNLTSIGFMSISLTMIQVSIKQGISEQALQKGLNTENTTNKYKEHRQLIKDNNERMVFMPYFLSIYNERHTLLKKREFLIDNNYSSEKALYESGRKRLIRKYEKIRVYLTVSRIKWATTDIVYNKYGQIITLAEHRTKRALRGIVMGFISMIGVTLLARGLFFEETEVALWQKIIKLLTYIVVIAITSVLSIIKEYEKGAFGVPNELEEINEIWQEFKNWSIPDWVIKDVECFNQRKEVKDGQIKETEERSDSGTDISVEQEESEVVENIHTDNLLAIDSGDNFILLSNDKE